MKKLFSSKSGFSLIEIIVAFAIFAVMAAMVSSIMSLALYQRNENLKFADDVEAQKNEYARIEKDLNYDNSDGSGGKIVLNFGEAKTYELDYSIKSVPGEADGIKYFVGNADYKKHTPSTPGGDGDDDKKDDDDSDNNSLVSQIDSYIYGSPNFEWIRVDDFHAADASEIAAAEGDGVEIPTGMTLYIMNVRPNDNKKALFNRDLIVWRNFSIRMPEDTKIYDYGYIQKTFGTYTKTFVSPQNLYEIVKTGDASVNITIPQSEIEKYYNGGYNSVTDNDKIYHFNKGIEQYYFVLETSKTTFTNKSFGDKYNEDDEDESNLAYYRANIVKKDNEGKVETDEDGNPKKFSNIYAAKDKPETPTT